MTQGNRVLGGILLVAGTSIGAGMLALPVSCAPSGFYYSSLLLIICWAFMYLTGLLVLEVNLSMDDEPSYITMAHLTLGKIGGWLNWLFFLGLLYSLLAAYVAGGSEIFQNALDHAFGIRMSPTVAPVAWAGLFAIIVFFGVSIADVINRVFMLGLIAAYIFLLSTAAPHVSLSNLAPGDARYLLAALPVLFATLAFHIIVPSLRTYLSGDVDKLKRIIFFGSMLPLIVYIIWELVIFGTIGQSGEQGLLAILKSGDAAVKIVSALQASVGNDWINRAANIFVFFAIASSFLGVAYGLFDLLGDGLNIEKTNKGRMLTMFATFFPPILFAEAYPQGFILALKYAGVFVAIIHGIFPVLMAISARYFKRSIKGFRVGGGVPLLILIAIFFCIVIFADIAGEFGWIPSMPS